MVARTKMIGTKVTPAVYDVLARMAAVQEKSVAEVARELIEKALENQNPDVTKQIQKLDEKLSQIAEALNKDYSGPAETDVQNIAKQLSAHLLQSEWRSGQILSKLLEEVSQSRLLSQFAALYGSTLNRSMTEKRTLDAELEKETLNLLCKEAVLAAHASLAEIDKHLMKKKDW